MTAIYINQETKQIGFGESLIFHGKMILRLQYGFEQNETKTFHYMCEGDGLIDKWDFWSEL